MFQNNSYIYIFVKMVGDKISIGLDIQSIKNSKSKNELRGQKSPNDRLVIQDPRGKQLRSSGDQQKGPKS